MFLDQLLRLVGGLVEFFIVLVWLVVLMAGLAFLYNGYTEAGLLFAGGAAWLIISAVENRQP